MGNCAGCTPPPLTGDDASAAASLQSAIQANRRLDRRDRDLVAEQRDALRRASSPPSSPATAARDLPGDAPPARAAARRPPPARTEADRRAQLHADIAKARRDLRVAREREALLGREPDGADEALERAVARARAEARKAAALLARAAGARSRPAYPPPCVVCGPGARPSRPAPTPARTRTASRGVGRSANRAIFSSSTNMDQAGGFILALAWASYAGNPD